MPMEPNRDSVLLLQPGNPHGSLARLTPMNLQDAADPGTRCTAAELPISTPGEDPSSNDNLTQPAGGITYDFANDDGAGLSDDEGAASPHHFVPHGVVGLAYYVGNQTPYGEESEFDTDGHYHQHQSGYQGYAQRYVHDPYYPVLAYPIDDIEMVHEEDYVGDVEHLEDADFYPEEAVPYPTIEPSYNDDDWDAPRGQRTNGVKAERDQDDKSNQAMNISSAAQGVMMMEQEEPLRRSNATVKFDFQSQTVAPGPSPPTLPDTNEMSHVQELFGVSEPPTATLTATATPTPTPTATASNAPIIMCCYFKQNGRCKMGSDCWYSHEGDMNTPCHYGAGCKAGHAHLAKTGAANARPVPKPKAVSELSSRKRMPMPAASASVSLQGMTEVDHQDQNHNVAQKSAYPANQPIRSSRTAPPPAPQAPSRPFVPSNLPCPYCGSGSGSVSLQEFPVYEGSHRYMAWRGHCSSCLRTFGL